MPIITISRGSYSRGKEVAEKVGEKLGYECVAREVLIEASREFNVDEAKLVHAISDAPSFFGRFSYGKERYIAYIASALLAHLVKDNVVYHGLAGQFFVRHIAHALTVRIVADRDERIELVMSRDRVSRRTAGRFIARIDKERKRWSHHLYGIDNTDPTLYDLVIQLGKIGLDDAVEIISYTARLDHLQATEDSRRAIENEALAAAVKAAVIGKHPDVQVIAEDGTVKIAAKTSEANELRMAEQIERIAKGVPGVKEVKVQFQWFTPFGT